MKVGIIGGGPAGYEAALALSRQGIETVLIEKMDIGGTCVNRGCIPTRACLQAIKSAENLAGNGCGKVNLSPEDLRKSTALMIQKLTYGMAYMLQKQKVQLTEGEVSQIETGKITMADGSFLNCDEIIVATGSEPVISEEFSVKNRFSQEQLLTLENLPKQLDIIGAGVLGTELAVILQYLGVEITLHEYMPHILPGWDMDVSAAMSSYLKRRGIQIETEVKTGVFENAVFCCGRGPKLPEIKGSPERIHLIGDCRGQSFTADTAAEDGRRIAALLTENTTEKNTGINARMNDGMNDEKNAGKRIMKSESETVTARCIFTPLEAASAGSLCEEGMVSAILSEDMMAGGVLFGTEGAFVKAVMEKETHILRGFHAVSYLASEIIQIGQTAIAAKMTAEEFLTTVFPHPTEGELLKDVVRKLL